MSARFRPAWLVELHRQRDYERYIVEITNGAWKKTTCAPLVSHARLTRGTE